MRRLHHATPAATSQIQLGIHHVRNLSHHSARTHDVHLAEFLHNIYPTSALAGHQLGRTVVQAMEPHNVHPA